MINLMVFLSTYKPAKSLYDGTNKKYTFKAILGDLYDTKNSGY